MPKFTWSNHKSFGNEENPPPPYGKNSQKIPYFFSDRLPYFLGPDFRISRMPPQILQNCQQQQKLFTLVTSVNFRKLLKFPLLKREVLCKIHSKWRLENIKNFTFWHFVRPVFLSHHSVHSHLKGFTDFARRAITATSKSQLMTSKARRCVILRILLK